MLRCGNSAQQQSSIFHLLFLLSPQNYSWQQYIPGENETLPDDADKDGSMLQRRRAARSGDWARTAPIPRLRNRPTDISADFLIISITRWQVATNSTRK